MYTPAPTLTAATARAVQEAGLHAIAGGQRQFDLSAVTTFDSSAVAVLLAWQRAAAGNGGLQLQGIPQGLASLAALYGTVALLGLE